MAQIKILSLPAPAFARLTYPRYQHHIDGTPAPAGQEVPRGRIEAVGAWMDDVPAGLALISHHAQSGPTSEPHSRLLSILVSRFFRRSGLGTRLMSLAEDRSRAAGSRVIGAYHSNRTQNRHAFETLLASRGWAAPTLHEYRVAGPADWTELFTEAWSPLLRRLREKGFSITPWEETTEEDKSVAATIFAAESPLPSLDFRLYEPHSDLKLSIALRCNGRLVGWVFAEPVPETNQFHYSCGYVRRALQNTGWLIGGIYEVSRLQARIYGPKTITTYETLGSNHRMVAFMRRQFAPFSPDTLSTDERYESRLTLA